MDSRSVLRNTVAAVIAATVAGGGSGVAWAGEWAGEWAAAEQTGESVRPVTHVGVWTTRVTARPPRFRQAPAKTRSKAYAFRLVTRHTWSGQQFQCLDSLWTRESNWDHRAYNQGSGAYGIPQALPGRKMGYVAGDWRFNPQTQIRWGLRYIKGRYGSPCGAWGHFRSHNWY
ncbi:lytic transglycosylase domain-containing protein [Microbispora bryophytorum]|uniref:Lytic transglycosylase domain-containing protein n=1 Tax=Microbispora bryophytorum subsp. camponoti TaxID=1677852 RepID=A0ABR8L196_9ACTN|nr:lytic transglycosylase domain-containing protein [Microbispora camponoti]MBD3144742.1 lytic transglycosylase domain-containing protein [Microbispora camponoti]